MKKRGNISIKAKLLGVITPVVIAIVVVLVLVSYLASAHIIENYSQNLLESSVENQTSKIESWLDENLSSFQMAKTTIDNAIHTNIKIPIKTIRIISAADIPNIYHTSYCVEAYDSIH